MIWLLKVSVILNGLAVDLEVRTKTEGECMALGNRIIEYYDAEGISAFAFCERSAEA